MVTVNALNCPCCKGALKYYDSVQRILKTKYGRVTFVIIRRLRCCECSRIHREIPEFILPFKHYEKEIIIGVIEGLITCNTISFEDYPTELTMSRWINSVDILVVQYT